MSTVKTIEIEVNAGKAEKDLKGLDKGLQKVDKSVEDIGDTSKETQKEMGAFGTAIDKVTGGVLLMLLLVVVLLLWLLLLSLLLLLLPF